MAVTTGSPDEGILVHLSVEESDPVTDPNRHIRLTRNKPTISVGRASKTASKGFVSSEGNAWFDSRVMSRKHAEILADFDTMTVYIKDIGSLHGTYINGDDQPISTDTPYTLHNGDSVRFGISIFCGSDSYPPLSVTVGIEHLDNVKNADRVDIVDCSARRVFRVSAPEYTEDSDDDEPSIMGQTPTAIDLTQDVTDTKVSQHEALNGRIIDLTSPPPTSPDPTTQPMSGESVPTSETAHHTTLAAKQGGARHVAMSKSPREEMEAESVGDYDEDSIRLSDSDEDSKLGDSDAESDIENTSDSPEDHHGQRIEMSSQSDGEERELSPEDYSSDDEESLAEDPDEQPLWDAESEELDAEDDFDADFAATLAPNDLPPLKSDATNASSYNRPLGSTFVHPPLPSIAPLMRASIPSDALMPKSYLSSSSKSTAEALGAKTGKQEYFEARQVNKITAFQQGNSNSYPSPPDMSVTHETDALPKATQAVVTSSKEAVSSVVVSTDQEVEAQGDVPPKPETLVQDTVAEPFEEGVIGIKERHEEEPRADVSEEPQGGPAEAASSFPPHNPWLETGEQFLNSPPQENRPMPYARSESEEAMTSAFAFHQYKMAMAAKDSGAELEGNSSNLPTHRTHVALVDILTGSKRKAADISTLSREEIIWSSAESPQSTGEENGAVKTATADAQKSVEAVDQRPTGSVQLISPPASPSQPTLDEQRPTKKLRTIAERVGYAALGGATVGAMILGSLIYTAPSLA